jgi:glutathione S-transferase
MLTIWGRKTSSNVQALMWCVGELGLSYERIDAGHRYGGTDTLAARPAFREHVMVSYEELRVTD